MGRDIESSYWPSTADEPAARLCNFATNKSALLPAHQQWLRQSIVPILRRPGHCIVEIGGLASRLGPAAHNLRLGQARADATKDFLEQQLQMSLPQILTASYGESVSGGGADNNDGYWRAVLIKLHSGAVVLPPPPPQVKRPPTMPTSVPKMYFGAGINFGGIVVGGTQALEGYLFSADDFHDRAHLQARKLMLGVAGGGGFNGVFIIANGGARKRQYVGTRFRGWDFSVSLGGRWADVIKGARRIPAFRRISEVIKQGGKSRRAMLAASKLTADEWELIVELVKTSGDALGFDENATTPQVNVFDIPLAGKAVEIGFYRYWGRVNTFD